MMTNLCTITILLNFFKDLPLAQAQNTVNGTYLNLKQFETYQKEVCDSNPESPPLCNIPTYKTINSSMSQWISTIQFNITFSNPPSVQAFITQFGNSAVTNDSFVSLDIDLITTTSFQITINIFNIQSLQQLFFQYMATNDQRLKLDKVRLTQPGMNLYYQPNTTSLNTQPFLFIGGILTYGMVNIEARNINQTSFEIWLISEQLTAQIDVCILMVNLDDNQIALSQYLKPFILNQNTALNDINITISNWDDLNNSPQIFTGFTKMCIYPQTIFWLWAEFIGPLHFQIYFNSNQQTSTQITIQLVVLSEVQCSSTKGGVAFKGKCQCQSSQYADPDSNTCICKRFNLLQECHISCLTCIGASSNDCNNFQNNISLITSQKGTYVILNQFETLEYSVCNINSFWHQECNETIYKYVNSTMSQWISTIKFKAVFNNPPSVQAIVTQYGTIATTYDSFVSIDVDLITITSFQITINIFNIQSLQTLTFYYMASNDNRLKLDKIRLTKPGMTLYNQPNTSSLNTQPFIFIGSILTYGRINIETKNISQTSFEIWFSSDQQQAQVDICILMVNLDDNQIAISWSLNQFVLNQTIMLQDKNISITNWDNLTQSPQMIPGFTEMFISPQVLFWLWLQFKLPLDLHAFYNVTQQPYTQITVQVVLLSEVQCNLVKGSIPYLGKCRCQSNQYVDQSQNTCIKCQFSCLTCNSSETCNSCDQNDNRFINNSGLCQCKANFSEVPNNSICQSSDQESQIQNITSCISANCSNQQDQFPAITQQMKVQYQSVKNSSNFISIIINGGVPFGFFSLLLKSPQFIFSHSMLNFEQPQLVYQFQRLISITVFPPTLSENQQSPAQTTLTQFFVWDVTQNSYINPINSRFRLLGLSPFTIYSTVPQYVYMGFFILLFIITSLIKSKAGQNYSESTILSIIEGGFLYLMSSQLLSIISIGQISILNNIQLLSSLVISIIFLGCYFTYHINFLLKMKKFQIQRKQLLMDNILKEYDDKIRLENPVFLNFVNFNSFESSIYNSLTQLKKLLILINLIFLHFYIIIQLLFLILLTLYHILYLVLYKPHRYQILHFLDLAQQISFLSLSIALVIDYQQSLIVPSVERSGLSYVIIALIALLIDFMKYIVKWTYFIINWRKKRIEDKKQLLISKKNNDGNPQDNKRNDHSKSYNQTIEMFEISFNKEK